VTAVSQNKYVIPKTSHFVQSLSTFCTGYIIRLLVGDSDVFHVESAVSGTPYTLHIYHQDHLLQV